MTFAESDPSVLSSNQSEHLQKVWEGDYAYIQDRTPLLVQASKDKNCELVIMPDGFLPMPFGIGLQKGSPYYADFRDA